MAVQWTPKASWGETFANGWQKKYHHREGIWEGNHLGSKPGMMLYLQTPTSLEAGGDRDF